MWSRTGAQSGGPEGARGGCRWPVPGWTAWMTGEGRSAGGSGRESRAMEDRATQRASTERLLPYSFPGLHVLGCFMGQN